MIGKIKTFICAGNFIADDGRRKKLCIQLSLLQFVSEDGTKSGDEFVSHCCCELEEDYQASSCCEDHLERFSFKLSQFLETDRTYIVKQDKGKTSKPLDLSKVA